MAHILVVDDEPIVTEVVARYLKRAGHSVTTARDGASALVRAREQPPELVVLDLMLPGLDGLEVCRRLQASRPVPVIMLTARGEHADRIRGPELGADDYVVKPFSPAELVARVQAVLRRTSPSAAVEPEAALEPPIVRDGLVIDLAARMARPGAQPLDLTRKEFDLLAFLARHPGQAFTRAQILDRVWDGEFDGDPSTVTVHVRRLREKLEPNPDRPTYVQTVWGVGYRFGGSRA